MSAELARRGRRAVCGGCGASLRRRRSSWRRASCPVERARCRSSSRQRSTTSTSPRGAQVTATSSTATSTSTARSCSAASPSRRAARLRGVAAQHRQRSLRRVRRPPARGRERADLRLDAVPGGQDDPLPQRELAPAALAAASSSSSACSPRADRRRDAAPRLPRGARACSTPRSVDEFAAEGPDVRAQLLPRASTCPGRTSSRPTDKAEVEKICAEGGMSCEWTETGLRLRQRAPARRRTHPRTGEKLFFNQVQLHHVSCLDPTRRAQRCARSSPRRTCRATSTTATGRRSRTR